MKKVVVTAKLPGRDIERLAESYYVKTFDEPTVPETDRVLEEARDAHALITMVSDRITAHFMDRCPDLKIISNCAVGYENIDIPAAAERGIYVTNTPDVLTEATADLAWSLILSTARRIVEADRYVRDGRFVAWKPTLLLGMNVYGKTLGIFGMGRIGSAVARRARGFDMEVIYHNRNPNPEIERKTGAKYVGFGDLLWKSDFLVISSPLSPGTRGKFGTTQFESMKNSAIIVNVGRGPIIKETELVEALKKGVIRGAGLDVFENEPDIDPGLMNMDNVVLLPHMGSGSRETREEMAAMAVRAVEAALRGETPEHLVNREALGLKTE